VVHARIRDFDSAKDAEVFCPGYRSASQPERENCWLLLVSAISKFESNFKVGDSFREPTGQDSIGLLALSPGECPNAPTARQLMDPVQNLICGVNMMAKLIARRGYIDGSTNGRGGATDYWSTLKPRHKRFDKTRNRYLNLGYKAEIIAFTKRYRDRLGSDGLVRRVLWEAPAEEDFQLDWRQEADELP
jgi:hypothetical protein